MAAGQGESSGVHSLLLAYAPASVALLVAPMGGARSPSQPAAKGGECTGAPLATQPGNVPVGRPQRFGMRAALPLEARPLATAAAKARPRLERLSAEWLSG